MWDLLPPTLVGIGALIGSLAAWKKGKEATATLNGDLKFAIIETQAATRYLIEWARVHDLRHENLGCDFRHGESYPSHCRELLDDLNKIREQSKRSSNEQ